MRLWGVYCNFKATNNVFFPAFWLHGPVSAWPKWPTDLSWDAQSFTDGSFCFEKDFLKTRIPQESSAVQFLVILLEVCSLKATNKVFFVHFRCMALFRPRQSGRRTFPEVPKILQAQAFVSKKISWKEEHLRKGPPYSSGFLSQPIVNLEAKTKHFPVGRFVS